MSIEIRAWQPGDEEAVLALFEASFRREMRADFWNWRFRRHPAGDPLVMLAWDADRLVAHYGASHAPLRIGRETVPAALSMSTMTHPDYRGRGLLEKTGAALYETLAAQGCKAVWGFPNHLINVARQRKLGWTSVCDVATLSLDTGHVRGPAEMPAGVTESDVVDARFERAAYRSASAGTIRGLRNRDVLAWRIDQNPVNRYVRLVIPEGDEIAGYAICKRYGEDHLDLAELVAVETSDAERLITAVLHRACLDGLSRVNTWCLNRDPNRLAFERLGFVAGAPVTYLGGRALGPLDVDLTDPRLWRLSMLDSDLY